MELDFILIKNRYDILSILNNMFLGIDIILFAIGLFVVLILNSPYDSFSILFIALIGISMDVEDYIIQEIEKRLDFETDIEIYKQTGAIPFELFENIIKPVNRDKFHIYRELNEHGNISDWSIYRKDMSVEDYFKETNKPILTGEDGLLSLIYFVEGVKEDEKSSNKRSKKTNGKRIKAILD